MKISARNQLKGTVIEIKEGMTTSTVKIDIGDGKTITSSITMEALKDLDIKVGSEVTTVIKSSSVMLMV